jgi:hypothetical protein
MYIHTVYTYFHTYIPHIRTYIHTCIHKVAECINYGESSGTNANDVNTLYELMNAVDPSLSPEAVQVGAHCYHRIHDVCMYVCMNCA